MKGVCILLRLLAVVTFLCIVKNGFGQEMNIVPPTPNAMKMTEYYAQRPGMYTGTANVSIPLYTIDFDGWQLPLSVSYNATGIRTNEEASEVGLGWSLSATGVISRTVTGGDDLFTAPGGGKRGYVYNTVPVTFELGYDWKTATGPPASDTYYYTLANEAPDTQPDLFNYNFFGYSGSFVLPQKAADPVNQQIKVVKITQDASSILFNEAAQTFTVNTPDGYKGEFTVKERSTTLTSSTATSDRMICCNENNIDIQDNINKGRFRTITSWYLSKITSPNGQVITLTYDLNADGSSPYLSNSIAFAELEGITSTQTCLQTIQEHVYLKRILSEEVDINFSMETREDLRMNTRYASADPGSYFPNSLPLKRYNGISITGVDATSTLNKSITFRQSYFNQQYQDQVSGNQSQTEVLWMRSRLDRLVIDDQEYRFYYEKGANGIPDKLTNGIDHFGFYNGLDQNSQLLPPDPADGAFSGGGTDLSDLEVLEYYKQKWERRVQFAYGKAGLLTKIKYPTRGYTVFEYEPHSYFPDTSGYFREQSIQTEAGGGYLAGGARIKSIQEYDFNDTLLLSKLYRYVEDPDVVPPANASPTTGRLMTPLYNRYAFILYDANPPHAAYGYNFHYTTFSSIPGNSSAEGKIIGYSKVHEIVSGRSESYRNSYYFENRPNKVLDMNSVAVGYPNLNGQAKEIRNYNSQGKIVQVTENKEYFHPIDSVKAISYQPNPADYNMAGGTYLVYYVLYTVRQTFNTPFRVVTTTVDQQATTSEDANGNITYSGVVQTAEARSLYNSKWQLRYKGQLNSFGDSIITRYKRPSDYTSPSPAIQHMKEETVNIVNPVIEETTYKNGIVISANASRYTYDATNNKINLSATYSYNPDKGAFAPSSDGNSFSSPYETKTDFTSYDPASGKPLEYISSDGVIHSFVWGYNKKLPVVHGAGISYTQLLQAHNSASSNQATYETTLRNDPNLAGRQVSTFAHIPLVGVKRITDPSAIKSTFEYDTYGRLQLVRDNAGNILSQNKYHFKTLPTTKILSLSATSLGFGTFYDCMPRPAPRTMTISNDGEGDVNITNISMPTGFSSSWHGGTIYAGTSVDVQISFTGGTGNYNSLPISIYSNNDAGTLSATASANYLASGLNRTIQLTPNPAIFPTAHSTQYIEVKNVGDDCLTISGTTLPANDLDWSASITALTLAPQQSTTMSVFLKTTNPALQSFSVVSDKTGGNEVLSVDIKRIILTPSSTSITFPAFTAQTATTTFTVTNTGNTLLDVSGISGNNPKFSFSPSSFQLNGSQQQTITVTYNPTDFSQQQLDLTFTSNKTEGPGTVSLYAQRTENYQLVWDPTSQVTISPTQHPSHTYLKNTGNVPATITGTTVTPPPGFAVTYLAMSGGIWVEVNPNTSPVTLQPGQWLEVSVTSDSFSSSATGSITVRDSLNNDYVLQLVKSPT